MSEKYLQLLLTHEEIGSLCGALNEVLEFMEDWQLEIRIGRTRSEIESLLTKIKMLDGND